MTKGADLEHGARLTNLSLHDQSPCPSRRKNWILARPQEEFVSILEHAPNFFFCVTDEVAKRWSDGHRLVNMTESDGDVSEQRGINSGHEVL